MNLPSKRKSFSQLLILFVLIALSSRTWSQNAEKKADSISEMNKVLKSISNCRGQNRREGSTDEVLKTASCYDKFLSKRLSPIRASGIIQWLKFHPDVRGWQCDGKEFQLESYNQYTPHFLCIKNNNQNHNQFDNVIFFQKEKGTFTLWSIYEPMIWLRKKEN
ncbi:MAG: hypothetical protein KDD35_01500 [Bdellovibrionales bacterium]|nr:hypothetical protein [Bdellovibrionales bacterium]